MRTVDDQGVYTGYTHKYISPTRQCNGDDFGDTFESSPENYICPDINEEDVKNFHLKNNGNAAWYGGKNAT